MIEGRWSGTTATSARKVRRTAMNTLARTLALTTGLALLPGIARATPTAPATLAALQTVAVADDAGVAQALAQPAAPGSTQVTVTMSSTGPAPAPACAAAPAPTVAEPVRSYPPPSPYYDRIHKDRKSGRGLLIGGLTLGGFTYLYVSLAGALIFDKARAMPTDDPLTPHDEGRARDDRRAFGRAMMIPGIGPALAIPKADTALQAWGAGLATITQVTAITMALVGLHRLGRARRLERLEQRWQLGAVASAHGGHVAVGMRF
jgi:hypothetical protein